MKRFCIALLLMIIGCTNGKVGSSPYTPNVTPGVDVTAAGTVTSLNNSTVPKAVTQGQFLEVMGAGQWDAGPVNLANTASVTGALPATNQAAQTLTGDIIGTTAADRVVSIAGDGGVQLLITPGNIQWPASATVNLTQTAPSSDVATTAIALNAQPPHTGAVTNINPGGFTVGLGTQSTGAQTSTSYVRINGDSTNLFSFGGDPLLDNIPMMWMGIASGSESSANYTLFEQSGGLTVNATSSVAVDVGGHPTVYLPAQNEVTFRLQAVNAHNNVAWEPITGTVDIQYQGVDNASGVVKTVSSASATPILTYTPPPGATTNGGLMTCRLVTRATTTGTGVAIGDTAIATYALGYKDVTGTVTLSTAGLTLVGAVQTTAAAVTSVLTAAASTSTVVISVTNTNLATFDSQVDCTVDVN